MRVKHDVESDVVRSESLVVSGCWVCVRGPSRRIMWADRGGIVKITEPREPSSSAVVVELFAWGVAVPVEGRNET